MGLTVLGWVAAAFGAGFSILQLLKTLTTKSTAGVTTSAWIALSCVAAVWVAYGFHNDVPQQYLPNVPLVITTCAMGWLHENKLRSVVPLVLLTLALGSGFLNPNIPGLVGVPLGVAMALPQLISTLRSSELTGVSQPAWVSQMIASVLWLAYAVGEGKTAIVTTASIQTVVCTVLIAVMLRRRRLGR